MIDSSFRIKKIFANLLWRSSLMGIVENGSMINFEFKQPLSWVKYSYKFSFTNQNEEYIEKEDEFDKKEEEDKLSHIKLDKNEFDLFPENSLFGIISQQKNFLGSKVVQAQKFSEKMNWIKQEDEDEESDEEDDEEERKIKDIDIKHEHRGWLKEEEVEESSDGLLDYDDDSGNSGNGGRMDDLIEAKLEEQYEHYQGMSAKKEFEEEDNVDEHNFYQKREEEDDF